jgi:hypothetical protein
MNIQALNPGAKSTHATDAHLSLALSPGAVRAGGTAETVGTAGLNNLGGQRLALVPGPVAVEIAKGAGLVLTVGGASVAAASLAAIGAVLIPGNGWRSFAEASRATLGTFPAFKQLNDAGKVVAIYRYGKILNETPRDTSQTEVRQSVIRMLTELVAQSDLAADSGGAGRRPPPLPPTASCTPDGRFDPKVLELLEKVNPDVANARRGKGFDNCVACSVAADVLLRTGRFHSASEYGPLPRGAVESMYGRSWQPGGDNLKTLARYFKQPGSTGLVQFDGRFTQHVFNVFNDCGVVRFFDAQTGRPVNDSMFAGSEFGAYWFIRTR